MRVAISGGTGFVGSHLSRALLDRGDEVTLLVRAETNRAHIDARAKTATIESLPDVDAIVNLAGAGVMDQRWTEARLRVLRASRVETTRALAERSKARVFVSASAVGYYGMRTDDADLDESSPPGDDVLARMCVDWEAAARGASGRVAIARIGIVLGKDGGALARMVPMFRRFAGGPLGSGKQWWSWIHVGDLVRALLFALDQNLEGPFNATAPAPATMNDVASELGRALHRPAVARAPAFAMRLALGERADVLLTGQRAIPMRLLGAGFQFRYPELRAAIEAAI
ncbi:MAG TPA: TIGR01777 family oxidoreductase [Polyangiaceae bacterium]|jgi:hypothetical protein